MKKLLSIALLGTILLFVSSCKEEALLDYEAYLTIVNIGNVPMNAAVEGEWQEIAAYSAATWAVLLDSEYEVVDVVAEAEPVIGDDYDTVVVRLNGDRDVKTWLTGWDLNARSATPQKKKSQVLSGQQDVTALIHGSK